METKFKCPQVYISEEPIEVPECQDFSISQCADFWKRHFSLTFNKIAIPKKFKKRWHRDMRRECRMIKQIDLLEENPKHMKVLLRCVKYNQRPSKKLRDMYSDVIRRLPGQHRFYEQ